ncbi:MAG: tetratricopeptide repeat protein [Chloroflexi bacterium]|nr:tetratricopeptide repeat protein [Chloroflexota bacterium]
MSQPPSDISAKLETTLQELSKRPAQVLLYGAVMAAIATIGGATLSPPMAIIAASVGGNLLSNIIERVARKGDLTDEDFEQLQNSINPSEITDLLTADEFNRQVSQLVRHIDLQNAGVIERLDRIEKKLDGAQAQPSTHNCNFVPKPDRFVGREDELKALDRALSDSKTVAITAVKGIGGIGKSTLAKAFAQQDTHFGLKLWAEVGQLAGEDLLPRILREWTGLDFPHDWMLEQIIARSREILTERASKCGASVLLLIDDVWLETVIQARQLREAVPNNAKVLITTRSEQVRLALGCKLQSLDKMSPENGATLLLDLIDDPHAKAHRPELEKLSSALEGHPLALSLAARQVGLNPQSSWIEELLKMFEQGLDDGDDFSRLELDESEQKVDSVLVTLKLTYDRLGGNDEAVRKKRQRQFRALGVLPTDLSFQADHIWVLWGETDRKALAELVGEGLIKRMNEREDWYTQHRLLHAYARGLIRQKHELDATEQRHRNYLITLANNGFKRPPETWIRLDNDLEQIHSLGNELSKQLAGMKAPDQQDERMEALSTQAFAPEELIEKAALLEDCEKFALAVQEYIYHRHIGAEGRRWLWIGLTAARINNNQRDVGEFLDSLGHWYSLRNDMDTALIYREQSLKVARAQGDKQNEASALINIGTIWENRDNEKEKALEYYELALKLYSEIADKVGEGIALNNIGLIWDKLEQKQKALEYYQRALALQQEIAAKSDQIITLLNIGALWSDLGDEQKALFYFKQALTISKELDDKYLEAASLHRIGLRLWKQGQQAEAIKNMQTARDLFAGLDLNTEKEDKYLAQWSEESGNAQ